MHGYLILGPADTTWMMSTDTFITKLTERWSQVKITKKSRVPRIDFCWHIKGDDVDLQGHFDVDGLTVGFDRIEGYAIFACWYRSLIPAEVPLIMMDDCYNVVYPLTLETKPDDILSERIALRPPPDPEVLFTRMGKPSD